MKPLASIILSSNSKLSFQTRLAQILCQIIPDSCPFERTVIVGDITVHIPPLCKLNPFYDTFVSIKFKAATFLADTDKLN